MAKAWTDLIVDARTILQDKREPFRFADETLLSTLNQGLTELSRIRPDAFWDYFSPSLGDIVVPEVVTASPGTGQVLSSDPVANVVSMVFYDPLVFYVAGRTEMVDDEFVEDSRALQMYGLFKQSVVGL